MRGNKERERGGGGVGTGLGKKMFNMYCINVLANYRQSTYAYAVQASNKLEINK